MGPNFVPLYLIVIIHCNKELMLIAIAKSKLNGSGLLSSSFILSRVLHASAYCL